jgi:hypothetical protein
VKDPEGAIEAKEAKSTKEEKGAIGGNHEKYTA